MNYIYVIQDENGYVYAATYEESKAVDMCQASKGHTYREIPFYSGLGTEITVISGNIIK